MTERLLISVDPGTRRAVRVVGARAQHYRCVRCDRPRLVGNVYLGRVTRVVPSLDAAFVDYGLARDGFLGVGDAPGRAGRIESRCHEGQALPVQVVSDPLPGKGARVSAHLRLAGRFMVYRPDAEGVAVSRRVTHTGTRTRLRETAARLVGPRPGGIVVRTAAAAATLAGLVVDLDMLTEIADSVARAGAVSMPPKLVYPEPGPVARLLRDFAAPGTAAVVIDDGETFREAVSYVERYASDLVGRLERYTGAVPLFEAEGVAEDIDGLLERRVSLPGGGVLTIERTEGMWAIDVDTERATGRAALQLNLAAAQEAARQLRLRDITGLVVIDFAGMAGKEEARAVGRALRHAVAQDDAPVRVAPISPFGTIELTRRRTGASLAETLTEACPACEGSGRRRTAFAVACEVTRACLAEAAARPGRRLVVCAAPDVIEALDGALGDAIGAACVAEYRNDPARARDTFDVFAEARR